jgi:hypothetical protein
VNFGDAKAWFAGGRPRSRESNRIDQLESAGAAACRRPCTRRIKRLLFPRARCGVLKESLFPRRLEN